MSMETSETLAKRLGKVPHFMNLPMAERLTIILAGEMRLFSPESAIISEGEPCSGMYVLLSGHVHICKHGPQGQENIIADVQPVIMFNEVALLDGGPNPYSAIAVQNCLTWHISLAAYQKIMRKYTRDKHMDIAMGLLGIMARRYRQLLENYADLSFLTVPNRVAKLIYELSDEGRKPINRFDYSVNEMASRISTVPEAISRSLTILKNQGIIDTNRTRITILEPQELAKLVKPEGKDLFSYSDNNE